MKMTPERVAYLKTQYADWVLDGVIDATIKATFPHIIMDALADLEEAWRALRCALPYVLGMEAMSVESPGIHGIRNDLQTIRAALGEEARDG